MPLKKDEAGKRWVEMEFLAPGTPEQVWQAMATGPGNTAWFTKANIDERVGGEIAFDFGPDVKQSGEITEWEPPHRFGYVEREWSEGAPPVATEITITARSGDRCLVRMVHSLFTTSDAWDDEIEGFEKGWPGFVEVLHQYLTHFAGQKAASFTIMKMLDADHLATWKRLVAELDLVGADLGEHRATLLSGVVVRVEQMSHQRYIMLRLDAPSPGVALIGTFEVAPQVGVSMNMYFYGEDAEERASVSEPRWREWIDARFGGGGGSA